ncbi:MAG: hypothetical protein ABI569_10275 [Casimicrobiaceae bacterium]
MSKLFVGINIKLKGVDISDCDVLIDVAEGGELNGDVKRLDDADRPVLGSRTTPAAPLGLGPVLGVPAHH